jgi:hypothetical protein
MNKKESIIAQIKNLIDEYGFFGTNDVQASYSPTVKSRGNLYHLIDYFNKNDVEVCVYDDGNSVLDEYTLPYEKLPITTLEYILELAQDWEQLNLDNNE